MIPNLTQHFILLFYLHTGIVNISSSATSTHGQPDNGIRANNAIAGLENNHQLHLYSALTLTITPPSINPSDDPSPQVQSIHQQAPTNPTSLCRPWLTPSNLETKRRPSVPNVFDSQAAFVQENYLQNGTIPTANEFHSTHDAHRGTHNFFTVNQSDLPTSDLSYTPGTLPSFHVDDNRIPRRTLDTSDVPSNTETLESIHVEQQDNKHEHLSRKIHKHKDSHKKKKKKRHKHKKKSKLDGGTLHTHKNNEETGPPEHLFASGSTSGSSQCPSNGGSPSPTIEMEISRQLLIQTTLAHHESTVNDDSTWSTNQNAIETTQGEMHHKPETNAYTPTKDDPARKISQKSPRNSSEIPGKHLPPRKRHKIYLEAIATSPDTLPGNQPEGNGFRECDISQSSKRDVCEELREQTISPNGLNGLTLLAMECARQQQVGHANMKATSPKSKTESTQQSQFYANKNNSASDSSDSNLPLSTSPTDPDSCQPTALAKNLSSQSLDRSGQTCVDASSQPDPLSSLDNDGLNKVVPVMITAIDGGLSASRSGSAFVRVQPTKKALSVQDLMTTNNPTSSDYARNHQVQLPSISYFTSRNFDTNRSSQMQTLNGVPSEEKDKQTTVSLTTPSPIFTFSNLTSTNHMNGFYGYLPTPVRMSSSISAPGLVSFPPAPPVSVNDTYQLNPGASAKVSSNVYSIHPNLPKFDSAMPPLNGLPFTCHARPHEVVPKSLDSKIPYPQPLPIMNSVVTHRLPSTAENAPPPMVSQSSVTPRLNQTLVSNRRNHGVVGLSKATSMNTSNTPDLIDIIPGTLNGLPGPANLPHRPSPIRPTLSTATVHHGDSTTQLNIILPKEQTLPSNIPAPSSTSSVLMSQSSGSSDVLAKSSVSNVVLAPTSATNVALAPPNMPNDLPSSTTQIPSTGSQQLTISAHTSVSSVPNMNDSTVLPLTILPSLPTSTLLNTTLQNNLPIPAAVTDHHIPVPLPPLPMTQDAILATNKMNHYTMPVNGHTNLSTIDQSQLFTNHLNGFPYPVNGTVRDAIVTTAQYNGVYAPLKRAPGRTKLANHLSSGMPVGESSFLCDVCNKVFPLQRLLKRHMKCHSAVKKYNCAHCSKGFNDTFDLKRHVRTHTGTCIITIIFRF